MVVVRGSEKTLTMSMLSYGDGGSGESLRENVSYESR